MARPRKEGMDYFPHDTDASNDKKIKALKMLYGNDGYAFYFILLEMIYREPNFELDISDAETIQILAKEVGINEELFMQILTTSIKRECFDSQAFHERSVLTSNGIKKRASIVIEKREKMRQSYEKSKSDKPKEDSDAETPAETPQSKSKSKSNSNSESKEKEKELKKEYADYVFLTETEYGKLTELLGDDERDKYFLRYASWISGQKKHVQQNRSAYLTILNWHRDNEKKRIDFPQGKPLSKYEQKVSKLDQMLARAEERKNGSGGYYQTGTDLFG